MRGNRGLRRGGLSFLRNSLLGLWTQHSIGAPGAVESRLGIELPCCNFRRDVFHVQSGFIKLRTGPLGADGRIPFEIMEDEAFGVVSPFFPRG